MTIYVLMYYCSKSAPKNQPPYNSSFFSALTSNLTLFTYFVIVLLNLNNTIFHKESLNNHNKNMSGQLQILVLLFV